MTDNNSTEISEDVDFEQSQNDSVGEKSSSGGNGLVILLFLLLLLLIGGAGYWLHGEQQKVQVGVDKKLSQYSTEISQLSSQVTSGGSDVEEKVSEISTAHQSALKATEGLQNDLDKISNQQQVIEETLTTIQNNKPKQESDWVLAEVAYLLTIAQQRISLERDVPSALAALQGADNRLRDLANPNLNVIREHLIKEMSLLRSVEDADISGMVIYLADITSRVESLPLKDYDVPTLNNLKIPTKEEAIAGNWKEMMLSMWGDLIKTVEIKDQNIPDEVLFDPEMRYFLFQNLQLELSSAKLSVLRRDSDSMKASLQRTDAILKRYFDVETAPVKAILEQTGKMQKADLKPELPTATQSLNELKKYILATKEQTNIPTAQGRNSTTQDAEGNDQEATSL